MIIGNGMFANALRDIDSDAICFFASGVSVSTTKNVEEFNREERMLTETLDHIGSKPFVYLSSCYAGFENNLYFKHKLNMEKIIKNRARNFYIFRLPQVVGYSGNKKNFI